MDTESWDWFFFLEEVSEASIELYYYELETKDKNTMDLSLL